ncbi:hypothetical protein R1flu_001282 [Riccia fluitans]|uniref:Uncharacterized protein n=1 Tax=Riccia fluitans TaxID=41844 RepID=A0ABD1Y630_9MARC
MASEQFEFVQALNDVTTYSNGQESEASRLHERDEDVKDLEGNNSMRRDSNGETSHVYQVTKEKMEDVMEEGDVAVKLAQQ